jgi:membrane-bound lytic murein transglycosylase D
VYQKSNTQLAGNIAGKVVERTISYKVKNGDSLSRIAGRYDVSVSDIIKWNNLSNNKYIQPGQNLTLKVDVKSS